MICLALITYNLKKTPKTPQEKPNGVRLERT